MNQESHLSSFGSSPFFRFRTPQFNNTRTSNMKTIVVFAALVAVTVALYPAAQQQQQAYLTREVPLDNIGIDGYRFGYELSDGQTRNEAAQVESRGPENGVIRVQGSYSFVGDDGQTYSVTYVADENGFHAQGAHLPVPPV